MKKKPYILAILSILYFYQAQGQISNYIYALNDASSGDFYFSRIEIATGSINNYQVASNILSNTFSACVSEAEQLYFLSTGKLLLNFNASTGNLQSVDTLPIQSTADFIHTRYNPCDSNIYGIVNDYPTSISFAKYNRMAHSMILISTLDPSTFFCMGCMSILDPDNGVFAFDNGNIIGLDLNSGQLIYNSPIINLPGETFHHIALKCSSREIFGTSANINEGVKFLSTINPYTGIVTHVTNHGWNVGILKPASGGDFINQLTGNYYYSAAGHTLVGANTSSGDLVSDQTINSGELYLIQHFTECACSSTDINEPGFSKTGVTLFPNPFTDKLTVSSNSNNEHKIILYDLAGRKVLQEVFFTDLSLSESKLDKGIYIFAVSDKNGIVSQGKIVKQ